MVKQATALEVKSDLELRQERFLMLVVHGDDRDFEGLSVSAAAKRLHLSPDIARRWWRSQYVQDRVREELELRNTELRLEAQKHRKKAIDTLVRATESPAMKPVQVRAAVALLNFGQLPEAREDTNVALQVVVNAAAPDHAIVAQQRRHDKSRTLTIPAETVAEGEYSEVD